MSDKLEYMMGEKFQQSFKRQWSRRGVKTELVKGENVPSCTCGDLNHTAWLTPQKGSKSRGTVCQERGHGPYKTARVIFGGAAAGNLSESSHCGEKMSVTWWQWRLVRHTADSRYSGMASSLPRRPEYCCRLTAPSLEEVNRLTESLWGVVLRATLRHWSFAQALSPQTPPVQGALPPSVYAHISKGDYTATCG